MKPKASKALPVLFLSLGSLGAAALAGQTPRREPAVVELPGSTRAMALGHAYQLGGRDPDALFYNPALVERARGISLGLHVLGDVSLAATLAASTEWLGGGVAVGVRAMEYETFISEPGAGVPLRFVSGTRHDGLDAFLREGNVGVSELVATAAYGRRLLGVRVGLAGKLIDQRGGAERDRGFALDFGVSRDVGRATVGLAVQDLGPALELGGEGRLPTRVTLGAGGYGKPVGPLDLGLAAAITRRADGEVIPGGGVEVGYWPVTGRTFVARVGVRRVPEGEALPVTFGGSFWGDRLVLDYAFQAVDGAEGVHRVTLGWR